MSAPRRTRLGPLGLLTRLGAGVALAISVAACRGISPPPAVAVYEEPRHHLVFQNRFVRVLDVVIPAGETTGYHTHSAPLVGVVLQDASNWTQSPGQPADAVAGPRAAGETIDNWSRTLPYTHRVANADTKTIHYLVAEWLGSPDFDSSRLPDASFRRLVKEGSVARFYRITLAPGEATDLHRHGPCGLTVRVTAGDAVEEGDLPAAAGGQGAGAWSWRNPGHEHRMRNRGASPVAVMEIDWLAGVAGTAK